MANVLLNQYKLQFERIRFLIPRILRHFLFQSLDKNAIQIICKSKKCVINFSCLCWGYNVFIDTWYLRNSNFLFASRNWIFESQFSVRFQVGCNMTRSDVTGIWIYDTNHFKVIFHVNGETSFFYLLSFFLKAFILY